jgi:hypothetical protein
MMASAEAPIQLVYLVAGIESRLRLHQVAERLTGDNDDHSLTCRGGHIAMVTDLQPFADLVGAYVEAKIANPDFNFPGVFEYEVTEELGKWYADNPDSTPDEFAAELHRQGDAFFAQGG